MAGAICTSSRWWIVALKQQFRDAADVYVAGNMLLYYVRGDPATAARTVFVVKGVPKGDRRSYLLWKERKAPSMVVEVTSRATHTTRT